MARLCPAGTRPLRDSQRLAVRHWAMTPNVENEWRDAEGCDMVCEGGGIGGTGFTRAVHTLAAAGYSSPGMEGSSASERRSLDDRGPAGVKFEAVCRGSTDIRGQPCRGATGPHPVGSAVLRGQPGRGFSVAHAVRRVPAIPVDFPPVRM